MRQPLTDFQLIRYIDSATMPLIAECGVCHHVVALDVMQIISENGANLWIGELRERLQCRRCGARAARIFTDDLAVMPF